MTIRLQMRVIIALWLALAVACPAGAEPTDTQVKAAFIPRFARYVSWPPEAMPRGSAPFILCIAGYDPFGGMLDSAARSQSIDGRAIDVRRIASAAAAAPCQIVFIGGGQSAAAVPGGAILTVTDGATTSQRGIIHFVISGGRVRFFIDQNAASRRRLTISSRLLALAVGVRQ